MSGLQSKHYKYFSFWQSPFFVFRNPALKGGDIGFDTLFD
jgi:hypothetical protein